MSLEISFTDIRKRLTTFELFLDIVLCLKTLLFTHFVTLRQRDHYNFLHTG